MSTTFVYRAFDLEGTERRGNIGADDTSSAINALLERNWQPISVRPRGQVFDVAAALRKRPVERLAFFRSYESLFDVGLGTGETFQLLARQARWKRKRGLRLPFLGGNDTFARSIETFTQEVASGVPVYEAMLRAPNSFDPLEAEMIRAGQEAGKLREVLPQIRAYLEVDRKFSKQIRDALFYPTIVSSFAVVMVIFIVVFVIPQFATLFSGFDVPLTPVMQVLLSVSAFLTNPFTLTVGTIAFVGIVIILVRALGTPAGALAFDRFRLGIPLFGELTEKTTVSRLCRMLSVLISAGRQPTRAVEIVTPIAASPVYARALDQAHDLMKRGEVKDLAEAFARTDLFEPVVIAAIETGVRTGRLDKTLMTVALDSELDIASLAASIPTVIQTVLTFAVGFVVALIVYSVYIPISQLVTSIH